MPRLGLFVRQILQKLLLFEDGADSLPTVDVEKSSAVDFRILTQAGGNYLFLLGEFVEGGKKQGGLDGAEKVHLSEMGVRSPSGLVPREEIK